ncbi:MAG: helix-turn-helix domain-containing protein [Trebonia sp.]
MSGDEDAAGARIARARRRRGLSQLVLAGLVGRSESWLSQVERGKRGVDSYAVLTRMAEVLRVEVEELTGPGGGDGEEGQRVYEPAAEIERAMMGYEAVSASIGEREPGVNATAAHLRARASAAYAGYQATRDDDTGRMLPALIRETEATGGDDRGACSVRALVYDTAAALLHRVGEAAGLTDRRASPPRSATPPPTGSASSRNRQRHPCHRAARHRRVRLRLHLHSRRGPQPAHPRADDRRGEEQDLPSVAATPELAGRLVRARRLRRRFPSRAGLPAIASPFCTPLRAPSRPPSKPAAAGGAALASAAAAAGSVADCQGAFIADVGAGAGKLAADEASALAGRVPACAGLTGDQIAGAYSNATLYLPQTPAAQASVPPPAPAAPSSSPPSLAGKTIATFSGSGIENTPKFTVPDTWKLDYSFDCSNFGYKGNFQVYEDGGFSGLTVSDLAMSKSGSTYAYDDAGTHYLEINSECSWQVQVIDEG